MNREGEEERVLALTFLRQFFWGGGIALKKKRKRKKAMHYLVLLENKQVIL